MNTYIPKSYLTIAVALFIILAITSTGYTDLGEVAQKNPKASLVASHINSTNDISKLYNQFNSKMNEYDVQHSKCAALVDPAEKSKCNQDMQAILGQAKDILRMLNQQADSVESKISLASNDKSMDAKYLKKLDRVLASVKEMRRDANKRLEDATMSG